MKSGMKLALLASIMGILSAGPLFAQNLCPIQWIRVDDLNQTKFAPGAAVFDDKIYAVGGHRGYGGYLEEAEVYHPNVNPPMGEWEWIESMKTRRTYPAVIAYNGEIWAINGKSSGSGVEDSIEIFNPSMGHWDYSINKNPAIPYLGTKTTTSQAVVLEDKLYVSGGNNYESGVLQLFKMWDGSNWNHLDSDPLKRLPIPITSHAMVVANNEIWVIGGSNNEAYQSRTFIYNPEEGKWRDGPPLNMPRDTHAAVTVGGKIFVMGGLTVKDGLRIYSDSVEMLDLSAQPPTWNVLDCAKFSFPKYFPAAVVLNNEIYIMGGDPGPNPVYGTSIVEKGILSNQCPSIELISAPAEPIPVGAEIIVPEKSTKMMSISTIKAQNAFKY